jgi:hypothetical protein
MPYISPKGALKKGIPSSKSKSEPASAPEAPTIAPALYLIQTEDIRPMDPKVVEELDQWKGWNARRDSETIEEDVDPLDEGEKVGEVVMAADLKMARVVEVEVKKIVVS